MSIFDLEDDVKLIKHKSETGLVKSKSVARSNSKRPPNNRLFTLQQSLSSARSSSAPLSSAYETQIPPLTVFNQYYTLACRPYTKSRHDPRNVIFEPSELEDPREVIRTRMIYLMPVYWNAYDPNAPTNKIPSHQTVWKAIKNAFEGKKADKKIFYGKKLEEQVKVWEAFLGESRANLFAENIENAPVRNELKKDFEKLVESYKKDNKKKEFLPPPVISFGKGKDSFSLEQFNEKVEESNDKYSSKLYQDVLKQIHPASLGYAYLEWYDDNELDPVLPEGLKKIYNAMAAMVSKSTLTAPKDKKTGAPKDYTKAFETIILALTGEYEDQGDEKKDIEVKQDIDSEQISLENMSKWSDEQQAAIAEQILGLQAGLASMVMLLMGGKEIDVKPLQNLAVNVTSKADIAGTGVDIVALINASHDTFNKTLQTHITKLHIQTENYVTDSAWANSFFAPALVTLGGTIHKILTTDWSELKLQSVVGKAFKMALNLTRASTQAAMFIKDGNKAWGISPIMQGAKVNLNVAGVVTGAVGVVLNLHEIYKQLKEITKLSGISERFAVVVAKSKDVELHLKVKFHKFVKRNRIENKNYEAFDVILQKMHHRKSYAIVGALGAVGGVGAGLTAIAIKVTAITSIVTLSNAWNPIGWTCAIVSVVGGLGLLGWKGGRRLYKKWRLKSLEKRLGHPTPKFCKTTGDYWRYQAALTIYFSSLAHRNEEALKRYPAHVQSGVAVGGAFAYILFGQKTNKSVRPALNRAFELGVPGIMGFIKG